MVPFAQDKVDGNGRLTDEKTRKKIRELLERLVALTRRMKLSDRIPATVELTAKSKG
jgi:chromate reductase